MTAIPENATPDEVVERLIELTINDKIEWRIDGTNWIAQLQDQNCSCYVDYGGLVGFSVNLNTTSQSHSIHTSKSDELRNILASKLPIDYLSEDERLTEFLRCIDNLQ